MSPKFSFKSGLLTLSLSVAGAFAVMTPAPEAHADTPHPPVACGTLKKTSVQKHCDSVKGDFKVIRDAMQKAQKAYNGSGKGKLKCGDCHKNGNKGGPLTSDAESLWKDFEPFFTGDAK